MLFGSIIVVHVIVCVLLILIVMIQQGRGGGLIDSLSSAENFLGTKTSTFLVKSTTIFATVFFITCLTLAFLSIQKGKSLIETNYQPTANTKVAASALNQTTTPEATPAPTQSSAASAPVASEASPTTTASSEVPATAPKAAPTTHETPAQK
jgi:preprotein translocase subunit SecG